MSDLQTLRHSFAHLLAAAVSKLHPDAKLGTGPATETGFFYDFLFPSPFSDSDLKAISKEMKKMLNQESTFTFTKVSPSEAKKLFTTQPLKLELISDLEKAGEKKIGIVTGPADFTDICAGPHVASTSALKSAAFQLDRVSGAFWKSDESNQQLTRISAFAFETKKELDEFLQLREEAKKRDHKILGKKLDLFSMHPQCPGMVFWHPKGMVIWNELEQFGKSLRKKFGGLEIQTPRLAKKSLWETSGHWDHYHDDMFHFEHEDDTLCLKPMDCPFNILIYQTKPRSYRDLPLRFTEIGRVSRNEKSGELNGLFRVQEITQDDSHILLRPDQVEQEILVQLQMVNEFYPSFGLTPEFFLATRPDSDFLGTVETWDEAETDLKNALTKAGITKFGLKEGDGAFYGPKIDVNLTDALGRSWQLATIQLDFQLPGRFDMTFTDQDGKPQTPIMIHSAIFGSFERFTAILTEHFAAAFPTWLSPIQVSILPIADTHTTFSQKIHDQLLASDFRSELLAPTDSLGKRIRLAETQKVPFILVIGDKEVSSDSVTVRRRGSDQQSTMTTKKFLTLLSKEIQEKQ